MASTTTNTGALVVAGGVGIGTNLNVGGTTTNTGNVWIASTMASTSTNTGALVVAGGVGIGTNLYVGGTTTQTGNVWLASTMASITTNTGALVVTGGVGMGGNLYVGGTSIIGNCTFLSTISEKVVTQSWVSGLNTIDYSNGSVIYLSGTPTAVNASFSINITNLPSTGPSTGDVTRSFIITLIYVTGGASQYCNSVQIAGGTIYTGTTLKFNGGSASIVTAAGSVVTQQISFVYAITASRVLSTVSVFS